MQLKETSRRHHPLIPVISVQSSNCYAQSAMRSSLHSLQISPSRYPCSQCSTTATIISGGTTRRGNSNYTLTVWKRWLKQTEGRPLYYLTLHLSWSPISSNHLPPFLSLAQSLLKKLSLFSSVSNYLHLLSGHLRIKTWRDHFQGATYDLTISSTHYFVVAPAPGKFHQKLIFGISWLSHSGSANCIVLTFWSSWKGLWFILGFSVFDNLLH